MFSKSLIQNYFRLMTPEEISELSVLKYGSIRRSLTEIMEVELEDSDANEQEGEGARILPFRKVRHASLSECEVMGRVSKMTADGMVVLEEVSEGSDSEPGSILELVEDEGESLDLDRASTSLFLMEEKRKLAKNNKKLKEKNIFALYKKTASLEIGDKSSKKEDGKSSTHTNSGILINRKQY